MNFRGDTDAFSFGVFAVDELAITDVAEDHGRRCATISSTPTSATRSCGQKFSRTDDRVSPRAALIIQPTKQQTYYFSYGTSFNPSAEALVPGASTTPTPSPEKNETFEVGAKWTSSTAAPRRHHRAVPDRQDQRPHHRPGAGRPGASTASSGCRASSSRSWADPAGLEHLRRLHVPRLARARGAGGARRHPGRGQAHPERAREHLRACGPRRTSPTQWQVGGGAFYVDKRFANNTNIELGARLRARRHHGRPTGRSSRSSSRMNIINISDDDVLRQVHPSHVIPGAGPHVPVHRHLEVLTRRCCCTCRRS